jgi:SAM-dependent methyltransferase
MIDGTENKDIYTGFAEGYDRVMRDVDFTAWAHHILELVQDHNFDIGRRVLNLACGTGNTESDWAEEGYEVTGIDQSSEMIALAERKTDPDLGVRYLVGDMRTIDLGEEFDLVCCLYDSLNYLTEPEDVQAFFERAAAHLVKGGCFIFDVATEANILDNFTSTTYTENTPDFAYIWENEYNLRSKICRSDFAFFYRDKETGLFTRRTETHYQRMYTTRDLTRWVKEAGFKLLGVYDGFTTNRPTSKSDRIHFVARKR